MLEVTKRVIFFSDSHFIQVNLLLSPSSILDTLPGAIYPAGGYLVRGDFLRQ
ncbi:MAG: hypothetical protein NTV33_01245 [Coprothermobacterota bacterium]|nr:hypothetical protein [Coprothermobacterota bacterium]